MVVDWLAGGGTGLNFEKTGEGSGELAVEGDLVTKEELGRAGVAGRPAEGGEDPNGRGAETRILNRHVAVHRGFLRSPHAQLTPASHRHGLDQRDLGRGTRLVFVHVAR